MTHVVWLRKSDNHHANNFRSHTPMSWKRGAQTILQQQTMRLPIKIGITMHSTNLDSQTTTTQALYRTHVMQGGGQVKYRVPPTPSKHHVDHGNDMRYTTTRHVVLYYLWHRYHNTLATNVVRDGLGECFRMHAF